MSGGDRVAVLCGGWSAEREVSLESGRNVLAALQRQGVDAVLIDAGRELVSQIRDAGCNRAFIALHGTAGEDGTVQAALELAGIPYTGSGVLASALAMSKWHSKMVWQAAGLPTPDFVHLSANSDPQQVAARLGLPLFVKPSAQGSSVGVSRVTAAEQIPQAWAAAAAHDSVVLAEQAVAGGEYSATILNGALLPAVQIVPAAEFYDYEAKYHSDQTRYECPAALPAAQHQRITEICLAAFALLGCRGWGRVDFMLDGNGAPQLIEVNTVPGLTTHSLAPMAARAVGMDFDEFILRVLDTSATAGAPAAESAR